MDFRYTQTIKIVLCIYCIGLSIVPSVAQARKNKSRSVPIHGSNYAIQNNPGGLRGPRGAFRYSSVAEGVKAMDKLLGKKYFSKKAYNTIDKYVDEYVGPIGAGKIEEYKRNISKWSGVPRNKIIDVDDRKTRNAILAAALRQESGGDWGEYINRLFNEEEILALNNY